MCHPSSTQNTSKHLRDEPYTKRSALLYFATPSFLPDISQTALQSTYQQLEDRLRRPSDVDTFATFTTLTARCGL